MPYYVHVIGSEPETGCAFDSKEDALEVRQDGQTITRVLTEDEKEGWRSRERERFETGQYAPVPWADDIQDRGSVRWSWDTPGGAEYCALEDKPRHVLDAIRAQLRDHYAHISISHPGMVAYTPDDVKGIEDRQTRTTPGRYLAQFASQLFSESEIATYVGRVKAAAGELRIARTADDIARVYNAPDAPSSCMSGDKYGFAESPTRVYGDSDLGVAYIGSLSENDDRDKDTIAARCIVWPDKRLYGRAYGDTATIHAILKMHGWRHGSMCGAHVRVLEAQSGDGEYMMPYIDGISSCSLVRHEGKRWFCLDDRGEYDCQNTDGSTGSSNTCSNCGERCGRDESYCQSCNEDRVSCEHCNEEFFDSSAGELLETGWYCDSCISDHSQTCAAPGCHERVCEWDFSRREQQSRDMSLCRDCEDRYTDCSDCGEYVETSTVNDDHQCEDCAPKPEPEPTRTARPRERGTTLRQTTATYAPSFPVLVRLVTGETVTMHGEDCGPFVLHATYNNPRCYTLTHKLTGLCVTRRAVSVEVCRQLAQLLMPLDWGFTDKDAIPPTTREHGRQVLAQLLGL